MADLFEYLAWRGDLTFTQDPPNAVDALVFSSLAYLNYGGLVSRSANHPVPLREAADEFFALEDHEERIRVKNDLKLLEAAARTRRFGDNRILFYRNILIPEEETQFAAVSFHSSSKRSLGKHALDGKFKNFFGFLCEHFL